MMLTAGGLVLILLGGVVATPGRAPDAATAGNVGLVNDNASATVAPNAGFLRTKAKAVDTLDEAVSQLRTNGSRSSAAAADRLEVISTRLVAATPSQPQELESIVADLNREVSSKSLGRMLGTSRYTSDAIRPAHASHSDHDDEVRDRIVGISLEDLIAILGDLVRLLFPVPPPYMPPYIPGLSPNAASRLLTNTQQQVLDPGLLRIAGLVPGPATMRK